MSYLGLTGPFSACWQLLNQDVLHHENGAFPYGRSSWWAGGDVHKLGWVTLCTEQTMPGCCTCIAWCLLKGYLWEQSYGTFCSHLVFPFCLHFLEPDCGKTSLCACWIEFPEARTCLFVPVSKPSSPTFACSCSLWIFWGIWTRALAYQWALLHFVSVAWDSWTHLQTNWKLCLQPHFLRRQAVSYRSCTWQTTASPISVCPC